MAPLAPYVAYEVARCCLVHWGSWLALGGLRWSVLDGDKSARSVLARSFMNVLFLGACGWRGLRLWQGFARRATGDLTIRGVLAALAADEPTAPKPLAGFVPSTPQRRLYYHDPDFQRLAAVMAAFQLKNLADTIAYSDGAIFFVHHVITVTTAVLALHPFAHFHGTFFFGISEISTTVLALLTNFSSDHGVPALEADYPETRKFVGALFAASFFLIRGLLWPVLSYFFVADCLHVLRHESQAHDRGVVWLFVAMLATLSVMQVLWLGQVGLGVYREICLPLMQPSRAKKED